MVIDNLVSNARKAGATKIAVKIAIKDESQLSVLVRDNGSGFDDRSIKRAFEFGFTTTNGSGLGLFHINKVMESMGGSASINKSKKGAEVELCFMK